ncbi:MAG: bifunctional UDP-N-acetylmuramoyl-tripeptide:D-alanyl-D-alanine ligase/alanine racemase [Bacteroidota bacterium]
MPYALQNIAIWLGAQSIGSVSAPDRMIRELVFDSRKVMRLSAALFFALQGKRRDGHEFIPQAYEAGIRAFVISKSIDTNRYPEADFLRVPNVLDALQSLAKQHRTRFETIPVIGITGSNGKTIVKEWLSEVLQTQYELVKSPKSYNSQIGVPLSVWQLEDRHQLAIFEVGISQKGEMQALKEIVQPNIGLLTNIGTAHDQGFISREEKLEEKLQLFEEVDVLILNIDQSDIYRKVLEKGLPTFTWGYSEEANVQVQRLTSVFGGQEVNLIYNGQAHRFVLPFQDAASLENGMQVVALALYLGLSFRVIAEAIQHLKPLAFRMELKPARHHSLLIDDSYSNDQESLANGLAFVQQQQANKEKVLILSDILESGKPAEALYRPIADLLQEHGIQRLYGVGEAVQQLKTKLPNSIVGHWFNTTADLLEHLRTYPIHNSIILIKGARTFGLERVANYLSHRLHRTVLEIDLEAMRHNLESYAALVNPSVKIMVMVKASAYGSGDQTVARMLAYHGVDYLGVAYIDEGVALRQHGNLLPIMVLNPEPGAFDALIEHQLEPVIYSLEQLSMLVQHLQLIGAREAFPIHIKLETGMNRLGFVESLLPELIPYLKDQKLVEVKSVFSHLAASEDPDEDAFSRDQVTRFERMSNQLITALDYPVFRHLVNSSGIIRFPEAHYDLVRLGIGLYGVEDDPKISDELLPVFHLKTYITQIKTVKAGETIGYGRSGKAVQNMRIATTSIGYADGFWRRLSNGKGKLYWNDQPAPVIGNVCMDMTMVDVSHLAEAKVGDELIVFGRYPKIQDFAQDADTIPYEILTAIADRVPRIYLQD